MRLRIVGAGAAIALVAVMYLWAAAAPEHIESPGAATRTSPSQLPALADAPEGLATNGSYVHSEIGGDGTIHVTEWIRSAAGLDQIRLAAYPIAQIGGGGSGTASTAATDVILVDGTGRVLATSPPQDADPHVVALVPSATSLRLSYDLRGAVTESGSVAGRALVRATSLDVDYDTLAAGEGPRTVEVSGVADADVLNLACTSEARGFTRPCGRPAASGWVVTLRGHSRDDRVLAQADLGP